MSEINSSNVFVLRTRKNRPELTKILDICGGYYYIGIIYKKSRNTTKQETDKTIIICPKTTIDGIKHKYNIRVSDYNWHTFPEPNINYNENWDLHISGMSRDLSASDAVKYITDKLECILPQIVTDSNGNQVHNFIIDFNSLFRETGLIRGYGTIKFNNHVSKEMRKLCKIVLHNKMTMINGNTNFIRCFWNKTVTSSYQIAYNYKMSMSYKN